jgi:hypothetical protein
VIIISVGHFIVAFKYVGCRIFFLFIYVIYLNYLLSMYLMGDVTFRVIRFNQPRSPVPLIKILLSPAIQFVIVLGTT